MIQKLIEGKMKKKEIKMFANLINEYIDREIEKSKLIYEEDKQSPEFNSMTPPERERNIQFQRMFGTKTPSDIPSEPLQRISAMSSPVIPKEYELFRKDAKKQNVINHAMLSTAVDLHYFNLTGEGEHKPRPVMLWGAPGIGKSEGVRSGAIRCAKTIAKEEGLAYIENIDYGKEFSKSTEELKKNLYFIEWDRIDGDVKDVIMYGPPELETNVDQTKSSKSSVHQTSKRPPAENLFIFFDVRVAGVGEQDILGIPFRVDKTIMKQERIDIPALMIDRLPFLKLCCDEKKLRGIIMWDEINQGTEQTQAALYGVVNENKVGESHLAPGIGQFAAANSEMWGGKPLLPALASRFSTSYLWLSPEEWLETYKSKLPPIVYDFIKENPKVSFYISKTSWKENYEPFNKDFGDEEGMAGSGSDTMEDYIKTPSEGRWPTPRDLTIFADSFKGLMIRAEKERKKGTKGWTERDIANMAFLLAKSRVGPVWAKSFWDYMYMYQTVKWETLVLDKNAAIAAIQNLETSDIVKELIHKHFNMAWELSKNAHNKQAFTKEATEVVTVLLHASDYTMDPVIRVVAGVKEEKLKDKNEDAGKVTERMLHVIQTGLANIPDSLKPDGQKLMPALKSALISDNPFDKKTPKAKFETEPLINPLNKSANNAITPLQGSISNSNNVEDKNVTEKYMKFKQLFEEVLPVAPQANVKPSPANEQTLMHKQQAAMQNIAKKIDAAVNSRPLGKQNDKEMIDIINREVLNDSTLTKEQKQKLISIIKDAPNSITAMTIISAYTTGNTFKLK